MTCRQCDVIQKAWAAPRDFVMHGSLIRNVLGFEAYVSKVYGFRGLGFWA